MGDRWLVVDEEALKAAVGARVRELRHEAGLSLEKLGERADVDATHLGAIERGQRSATIVFLAKIADGLGVNLETLIDTRMGMSGKELRAQARERIRGASEERLRALLRLMDAVE